MVLYSYTTQADDGSTVKITSTGKHVFYEWLYFVLSVKGWLILQIPALKRQKYSICGYNRNQSTIVLIFSETILQTLSSITFNTCTATLYRNNGIPKCY